MKTLEVEIVKADAFKEVRLQTAYIGKKRSADGTSFELLSSLDTDEDVLEDSWRRACADLDVLFSENYSYGNSGNGDKYEVSCKMTNNWNFNLESSINRSCFDFVVASMMSAWFGLVEPATSATYNNNAIAAVNSIKGSLNARVRPSRCKHNFDHEI